MNKKNQLGLFSFIGMTMSLCASVRNIPTLAVTGWKQIFFLFVATTFFALPVALLAGELGTAMPGEGGLQLWVQTGISERWGFVASWLTWVATFPGMAMVGSTLGPLLANSFGLRQLANNNLFAVTCILVCYWTITFLNLKFDMAKIGGEYGTLIGIYIPIVLMMVMGLASFIKVGVLPGTYLGTFSWGKLLPSVKDSSSLKYLGTIAFTFAGIEMSSVHITRLKNAKHNYPLGILVGLLGLVLLNLINSLLVSSVVPQGKMQLTNITQSIQIWCRILHWPSYLANIFSFMIAVGVLNQMSAWISGPSKAITVAAKNGSIPKKWGYDRTNQYGISRNAVLTQSVAISLFSLLFLLIKSANQVFVILGNIDCLLYSTAYVLIAISMVRLRIKQPDLARPYRLGSHGNFAAYLWSSFLIIGVVIILGGTFISSDALSNAITLITGLVLFIMPIIIDSYTSKTE